MDIVTLYGKRSATQLAQAHDVKESTIKSLAAALRKRNVAVPKNTRANYLNDEQLLAELRELLSQRLQPEPISN